MLPEQFSTTYTSPVDDVTSVVVTWDKKTHDAVIASYRDYAVVQQPELPSHLLTMKAVEAKPSAQFYGTQRNYLSLRQDFELTQPTGIQKNPGLLKFESSLPVGLTKAQKLAMIREFRAIVATAEFEEFILEQAT